MPDERPPDPASDDGPELAPPNWLLGTEAEQDPGSRSSRLWPALLLTGLVCLLIGLAAGYADGNGSRSTGAAPVPAVTVTVTATPSAAVSRPSVTAGESVAAATATNGRIGQPVISGDVTLTVVSVACGATHVGGQFGDAAKGEFCLLKLAARNNGDTSSAFIDDFQTLYDAAGASYPVVGQAVFDLNTSGFLKAAGSIAPGATSTGTLVFDVPVGFHPDHVDLVAGSGRISQPATVDLTH